MTVRAVDGKTDIWAIALSEDGRFLAGTTHDGHINVYDTQTDGFEKIRDFETKGSFGMCVDIVCFRWKHLSERVQC